MSGSNLSPELNPAVFHSGAGGYTDSVCWSRAPGLKLLICAWEGQWAVYDCGAGATHVFNELAVALWEELGLGLRPEWELLEASLGRLQLDVDEVSLEAARETLERFSGLGLARSSGLAP